MASDPGAPQDQPSRRKRGRPPHPDILTPREWQVLDLLRQDLTNDQIAHRLDISPATAKYHVSEILSKLNVATREEAAAWQPEAMATLRWWQRALVPLALRRIGPVILAKGAIGGAAIAAAASLLAGLGVLLFGALGSDGEGDPPDAIAATRAPAGTSTPARFRASAREIVPASSASPSATPAVSAQVDPSPTVAPASQAITPQHSPAATHTPTPTPRGFLSSIVIVGRQGGDLPIAEGSDPQWSPNGEWVAYLSDRSEPGTYVPTYALSLVRSDGTGARALDAIVQQSDALPYQCINRLFSWFPSSDRLLFCNGGNLYSIAINGSQPAEPILDAFYFSLSPDGTRIAYGTAGGQPGEIWIRDLTTRDDYYLTEGFEPTWSSDGRYLSFSPTSNSLAPGFAVIDITTRVITHYDQGGGWIVDTTWSPVNSQIAYSTQGSIYIVDVAASGAPRFVAQGYSPTWSPDGRLLVYGMGVNCSNVYTIAADGSDAPQRISPGRLPTWSPTGTGIAVVRDQWACDP